jgi:tungstate transport system ATP-binding protein
MSDWVYMGEGLRVTYGRRTVLRVDELTVRAGNLLGIVGPSGAGKSTLLRVLALLEPPTEGVLYFGGSSEPVRWPPPLDVRRRVTMVFQRPLLLSDSVFRNVAYGLRARGSDNVRPRVEQSLEMVGLAHMAHAAAHTLSGGELQRVALARALVLEPDVLLLDEPTANLDPYNVSVIEEALKRLRHHNHTTIVLVTHNVFQARRLADRVMFLLDGECVEAADAETFFESPKDPRTRAFVRGEMVY